MLLRGEVKTIGDDERSYDALPAAQQLEMEQAVAMLTEAVDRGLASHVDIG